MEACEHVLIRAEHEYELIEARAYLASQPPEALHQLRFRLAKSGDHPPAMCPYCQEPLRLAGGHRETGGPRSPTLHFRHRMNPVLLCIQKSAAQYTPEEIRAIKYCGQRESELHRWTKTALAEALRITPGIPPHTVHVEKRFPAMDRRSWRQPDVRAQWHDHDLVFEAQLDTTHISVLAERDAFYREQKSRLIWVFAVAPEQRLRFVEKDVLYNYRGNLFVFNRDCMALSQQAGRIILEAWWIDPGWLALPHGQRPDDVRWHSKHVSLEDLTFPPDGAPPYYVDVVPAQAPVSAHQDTLAQVPEEPWETELRELIEVRVLNRPAPPHSAAIPFPDRKPLVPDARPKMDLRRIVAEALQVLGAPTHPSAAEIWAFCKFGKAIFALTAGEPVHTNLESLIQVENVVYTSNRAFYRAFCYAWRHLQNQGAKGLLSPRHLATHEQHKAEFRRHLKARDTRFRQDHQFDLLIHTLWPWIATEMSRPTHGNERLRLFPGDLNTGTAQSK